MKKRTTQPKNNKYYIRQATGGLNGAVAGYPTIAGANVLANCVGYANGRFNEIINDPDIKGKVKAFKYQLVCNAENFIERAMSMGLKISRKPTLGGIMVWQKGNTLGGKDGAGHVCVVEKIVNENKIITSESGYNAKNAFWTQTRTNSNGNWGAGPEYKFRGCIINPAVNEGYFINGFDYSPVFDPTFYSDKYPDLKSTFGTDANALWLHFQLFGMNEFRQASAEFNPQIYKERYPDLVSAYGNNNPMYYLHYVAFGKAEGRTAN